MASKLARENKQGTGHQQGVRRAISKDDDAQNSNNTLDMENKTTKNVCTCTKEIQLTRPHSIKKKKPRQAYAKTSTCDPNLSHEHQSNVLLHGTHVHHAVSHPVSTCNQPQQERDKSCPQFSSWSTSIKWNHLIVHRVQEYASRIPLVKTQHQEGRGQSNRSARKNTGYCSVKKQKR